MEQLRLEQSLLKYNKERIDPIAHEGLNEAKLEAQLELYRSVWLRYKNLKATIHMPMRSEAFSFKNPKTNDLWVFYKLAKNQGLMIWF